MSAKVPSIAGTMCGCVREVEALLSGRTGGTGQYPDPVFRRPYTFVIGVAVAAGMVAVLGALWLDLPIRDPDGVAGPSYIRLPAIVLMAPLMFPIAKNLGINDIHYSMVVVTAMNIGLMTPPIGIGFYIACKIGNVSPDEAMGAIWPYILALLVGLVLIAAIPGISTVFL